MFMIGYKCYQYGVDGLSHFNEDSFFVCDSKVECMEKIDELNKSYMSFDDYLFDAWVIFELKNGKFVEVEYFTKYDNFQAVWKQMV